MNTVAISEIVIKKRFREDLGDIDDLAASIEDLGLLHPIVITSDRELIAGQRRIAAFKELERTEIPATIVDMENILKGQFDENKMRKDFTPSEAVALWMTMENRQGANQYTEEKEDRPNLGRSSDQRRDQAAKATGRAKESLRKARQVVEAAEADPEKYGDLKEKMDREDNVNGAYQELRHRKLYERIAGAAACPGKTYPVIYAIPPWGDPGAVNELKILPVKDLAAENSILFIWTGWKTLETALKVIRAWKFNYRQGYVLDNETEAGPEERSMLLLQCFRGSGTIEDLMAPGNVLKAAAEFPELIEKEYPGLEKLQLFGKKLGKAWDYLSPNYLAGE